MDSKNIESTVFTQSSHFAASFPIMEEIRRQGKLCDVTLIVDNQSFSAHRIVLAATIPYFHAMFTHDMAERQQKDIKMEGIDAVALESLINFVYSGRVTIDHNNVQSLMLGASFLQLDKVRDACADFLSRRLHPQNALGIKSFADALSSSGLVRAADTFILKHFAEVAKGEEFLSLKPNQLLEFIKRDELHVISEEQVFESVMNWVRKDPTLRGSHLPSLLTYVRLPLLTPHYLADHVATEELVRGSHECRDLLDEARDYHLMPERRPMVQGFRTRPRCGIPFSDHIFAVGGLTKSVKTIPMTISKSSSKEIEEAMVTDENASRVTKSPHMERARRVIIVKKMKVVYDSAERGVRLKKEFDEKLTKKENRNNLY